MRVTAFCLIMNLPLEVKLLLLEKSQELWQGFPPGFQEQLNQMLKSAIPPMFKGKKSFDPRRLIHVESEIDFLSRNWKYGDIINVTLEKVKKAEELRHPKE